MIRFPQLFSYMAGRIPCTCGCGLEVTYSTKRNHLNARGTTALRARMETETKSLKKNTQQEQKPIPLPQRGLKKRSPSNPDQNGSRKRHKAAQLGENQLPEITASSQVDTNMIEDLLPPVATNTDRQSMFIERSRGVIEMRWTTSRRDWNSHSDGSNSDVRDDDEDEDMNEGRDEEEEDNDEDGEDKDEDEEDKDEDEEDSDEDEEDNDEDEEDNDEDEEDNDGDKEDEHEGQRPCYDSEIPGISNWDLLGEDFEREAAALGLYFSRMNYLPS